MRAAVQRAAKFRNRKTEVFEIRGQVFGIGRNDARKRSAIRRTA
jgi:hypothetical protein